MSAPRKRITDSTFVYTASHNTDIRRTFAKERARLKKIAEADKKSVTPIRKKDVA